MFQIFVVSESYEFFVYCVTFSESSIVLDIMFCYPIARYSLHHPLISRMFIFPTNDEISSVFCIVCVITHQFIFYNLAFDILLVKLLKHEYIGFEL